MEKWVEKISEKLDDVVDEIGEARYDDSVLKDTLKNCFDEVGTNLPREYDDSKLLDKLDNVVNEIGGIGDYYHETIGAHCRFKGKKVQR
jgi:uncharacterized membrane-anchored protein YjiN (DUF445 family)